MFTSHRGKYNANFLLHQHNCYFAKQTISIIFMPKRVSPLLGAAYLAGKIFNAGTLAIHTQALLEKKYKNAMKYLETSHLGANGQQTLV